MNTLTPDSMLSLSQNAPFALLTLALCCMFFVYVWKVSGRMFSVIDRNTQVIGEVLQALEKNSETIERNTAAVSKIESEIIHLKQEFKRAG